MLQKRTLLIAVATLVAAVASGVMCSNSRTTDCFSWVVGQTCTATWRCPGQSGLWAHNVTEDIPVTSVPTKAWVSWVENSGQTGYTNWPVTCTITCSHPQHWCGTSSHTPGPGGAICTAAEDAANPTGDSCSSGG